MARTKGENKSKAIREFLRKNVGASVEQVVNGLKAEGIVVRPGLVYNVKSYDAKAGATKRAGTYRPGPKPATKAVASTNGAAGATKADQIREVAGGMEKPVRPRDVVAALRDQGIEVSRTQVSQVLTKMGMKRRRRRRKVAAASAAPTAGNSLNINDLVAAKKLVAEIGSIDKVREALAALARLS